MPALAIGQDAAKPSAGARDAPKAESSNTKPQERPGFFGTVGRWFDQTVTSIDESARYMRDRFQNLGRDASVAAKTTVDSAKDAADAVGRFSNARVVAGHQKCQIAPNGAPDCIAAAYAICQAKGYNTGKSLDMTTAEVCPPQVYLAGRSSGADCQIETFVSRALCQ
jgi:hypothetical protein